MVMSSTLNDWFLASKPWVIGPINNAVFLPATHPWKSVCLPPSKSVCLPPSESGRGFASTPNFTAQGPDPPNKIAHS